MIWWEMNNHITDCYFCMTNFKGINRKNKDHVQYPDIPSAMKPALHGHELLNVNVTVESSAESEAVLGSVRTQQLTMKQMIKLNQCHLHKVNWTTWHETPIFQRSLSSSLALVYARNVFGTNHNIVLVSTTQGRICKILYSCWSVFTGILSQYWWPQ